MYIYFLNLVLIAFFHYYFFKKNTSYEILIWIFYLIFLIFFIGLRHETGGDWNIYIEYYEENKYFDLVNLNTYHDVVFILINKFSNFMGFGIYGVNLFCSIIFILGLNSFLKNTPNKWLGLLICFPIVIVVLGMGYMRQAVAFAFGLFLISSLENRKIFTSIIYLFLAVFTHKTSLCLMFFYFVYFIYYKKYILLIYGLVGTVLIYFLFQESFNHLIFFYLGKGQHMISWGSLPRSALLSLVAIVLLYCINDLKLNDYQKFFYKYLSYLILLISPFSFISTVTTDRVLLYYCVIKIILVSSADLENKFIKLLINSIIFLYIAYFTLWISAGVNSILWLPYSIIGQ